jgi:hypothetical protein
MHEYRGAYSSIRDPTSYPQGIRGWFTAQPQINQNQKSFNRFDISFPGKPFTLPIIIIPQSAICILGCQQFGSIQML